MLVHVQCNCHVMWMPNTELYVVIHYGPAGEVDISNHTGWIEVEQDIISWGVIDDTRKRFAA
jgi:hypothetical protein